MSSPRIFRATVPPRPPVPLPQVLGPKLPPFTPTAEADIEFIEELGDRENDQDGVVWKVRINGERTRYALKMFYFDSFLGLKQTAAADLNYTLLSPQHYLDFYFPFSGECRAYGRLLAEQRTDLAVPAHGYLLLNPAQEAFITTALSSDPYTPDSDKRELDGTGLWRRQEENRHLPIHAIVKDLVPEDTEPFTPAQMDGMWRDLQALHGLGILVGDVRVGNYLGGKLIDFSRAWTAPHPGFVFVDEKIVDEECERDVHYLREGFIDYAREKGWEEKGEGEDDGVEMPQGLTECDLQEEGADPFGVDPRGYEWWKWEGGRDVAVRELLELVNLREWDEKGEQGECEGDDQEEPSA